VRNAQVREVLRHQSSPTVLYADGQPVHVIHSPCRFGGGRPWLLCQACGGRRLVLYRHPRVGTWDCRECLRLTYPSQRASRDLSLTGQLRVTALCRRFVPGWEYSDEWPEKPPGVRWSTWQRFLDAVDFWEARRDEAFMRQVSGLVARMERLERRGAKG